VIVNGATGGVGSLLVDILATNGFEVVALTAKTNETPYLTALGAAQVLPSTESEHEMRRPLESGRWQAAFDSVGGDQLSWLTRSMAPGGLIASFGNASGNELRTTVLPFILRGIQLIGVNVRTIAIAERVELWEALGTTLRAPHLDLIASTIAFSELPGAFERLLKRRSRGRTVVHVIPES
jgi:acrylyl-CoA reductase (NADPH)